MFKGFRVYRESEFKVGVEVFNLFNHPYLNLNNPGTTVPSTANVNARQLRYVRFDHLLRTAVLPDAGGTFDAVQRKVQLLTRECCNP